MNQPDFVNDEGIKWWHQKSITGYAKSKGLDNAQGFIAETPDGYKIYVLVMDNKIFAEDQKLDGIGAKIDMLVTHKRFGGE